MNDKNFITISPAFVIKIKIIVIWAVIENNSEYDIKDAVVTFVAWDENNLPVKIKGQYDFSDGSYVKKGLLQRRKYDFWFNLW